MSRLTASNKPEKAKNLTQSEAGGKLFMSARERNFHFSGEGLSDNQKLRYLLRSSKNHAMIKNNFSAQGMIFYKNLPNTSAGKPNVMSQTGFMNKILSKLKN